jgi:8-oxo-dGTP pyrophosphatase MutT (NUDIX family)
MRNGVAANNATKLAFAVARRALCSPGMAPHDDIPPSPASTVVLLRPPGGAATAFRGGAMAVSSELEVLLLRRSSQLAFYGGAWVFPGGRIDACDGDAGDAERCARNAAVRELAEESGVRVQPEQLAFFARWVTPPGRPRRFDTWYFAALAPDGAAVQVDQGEVDAYRWLTPRAALAARAEGAIELPPPTFVTLSMLAAHDGAHAAYRALSAAPLSTYAPRPCEVAGGVVYLYEGDAGYAQRDPAAPGARHRLSALADGWRYER